MSSRREQILAAALVAIDASTLLTTVDRSRTRTLAIAQLPAATIYPMGESVDYETQVAPRVERRLAWRVAVRALGTDTDLDPLHVDIVERIMADGTFGGIAVRTNETDSEWVLEESDEILVGCDISFETLYFTDEADQESAG